MKGAQRLMASARRKRAETGLASGKFPPGKTLPADKKVTSRNTARSRNITKTKSGWEGYMERRAKKELSSASQGYPSGHTPGGKAKATATRGVKKDPMSPGRYYSGSRSRAGTSKAVGRGSKELSSASQGYPPDKRRARAARLKYEARLRKEREANRNKK